MIPTVETPKTEVTRPAVWTAAMAEFASTYADRLAAKGIHPEPMNEATALLVAGHIERLRAQIAGRS
jgi:hypothetical protein